METVLSPYLVVKWIHVLSSTVLFGTGIGSAFYMLFVSLAARRQGGHAKAAAVVVRHVVLADLWFTTPAIIVQPLSGAYLVHTAGYPWTSPWLLASFALYLLAGACWLPVVWIQVRMRDLADEADRREAPLPPAYWRFLKVWTLLGIPAFLGLVVVFYLMVAKPA